MTSFHYSVLLASVALGQWTFSWPYGQADSCVCKRSGVSFVAFETEEECLQAFEDSAAELCRYRKQAVSEDQCDASVAKRPGLFNSACSGKCTQAVAGLIDLPDYFEDCDFEFVTEFEETVALSDTQCFNNLVYGWADFDPLNKAQAQPLRIFEDVPNAARCQELCQDIPQCVHFTWKAFSDHAQFENEAHTCVLHSEAYMQAVLNTQLSSLDSKYCDSSMVSECASITFPRPSFDIFQDLSCLLCDCVPKCAWQSPYHVSGPAFCDDMKDDLCSYERPSWSTAPPECETEECECHSDTTPPRASTSPTTVTLPAETKTQTTSTVPETFTLAGTVETPGSSQLTGRSAPTPSSPPPAMKTTPLAVRTGPATHETNSVTTGEESMMSTVESGTPEGAWTTAAVEDTTEGLTPEVILSTLERPTTELPTSSAETMTSIQLETSENSMSSTRSLLPPLTPCLDCPQFIESDCDDCEDSFVDDCMSPEC